MPNTMARVVIKIGRSRTWAASSSACSRGKPGTVWPSAANCGWRARIAKSTSKIAFFVTRPISKMTPMIENIDKVVPNIINVSTTPMRVSGSEVISASGCKKLRNWLARIM